MSGPVICPQQHDDLVAVVTQAGDDELVVVGPPQRRHLQLSGRTRKGQIRMANSLTVGSRTAVCRLDRRREDKDSPEFLIFPHSTTPPRRPRRTGTRRPRRTGARRPAGAAGGSTRREDKDSLTVGSRTAVRRLARRREDKDSPEFLIFPHSTTPPRRLPQPRRPRRTGARRRVRRAMSAFSRRSIRRLNAQPEGS